CPTADAGREYPPAREWRGGERPLEPHPGDDRREHDLDHRDDRDARRRQVVERSEGEGERDDRPQDDHPEREEPDRRGGRRERALERYRLPELVEREAPPRLHDG